MEKTLIRLPGHGLPTSLAERPEDKTTWEEGESCLMVYSLYLGHLPHYPRMG